ncbi:MAG: TetR/AcrR family transcriptional regulator [Phenylobacterium sp.]
MAATSDDATATLTVPAARTPTRRYEARRHAIIASAVTELNRRGMRGMTLGDVAARLDLVPTGVIYYFKNKEELAAACFMQGIERFEALIAQGHAAGTDDKARVRAFIRAFFAFKRDVAAGEAEQIAIFNDVRALKNDAVNEAYIDMFRHARDLITGPPGAELPRSHRNARTHLMLAELSWSMAWISQSPARDYGRVADRMGSILADGFIPPGGRWPRFGPLRLAPEDGGATTSAEQFLRAATRLINDEGYHGASVERISAKLNVSKGAFYHHNDTKDELVVACFRRTFEMVWRAIRGAEAEGGSGLKVLAQLSCALARYQLVGDLPLLRTSALTTAPEAIQPELLREFERISLRFASIISDGIADGSIRPIDANVGAQMVNAMINAAAELHAWAPGSTADTAVGHYVRPLFEGLASPAAA